MRKEKNYFSYWISLIKETYRSWIDHDPFRQSAIISYYSIFSLPALLVIVVAIADFFTHGGMAADKLFAELGQTMGENTSKQIREMVQNASLNGNSVWATILGCITLILGATGVFDEFHNSFNYIWDIRQKKDIKWWRKIIDRFFSFGLVLIIGFLLLMSLILSSVLAAAGNWISSYFSEFLLVIIHILNFGISFMVIALLFSLMFKVLPDLKISWRSAWAGGIITSILFTTGKYAIAFYFGKSKPETTYGAAGSVILIMLWVSYSSLIVFFGAEFAKKLAESIGENLEPTRFATKI